MLASVQNLLSSRLLYKDVKMRICKSIILPVVLYGFGTLPLTFKRGTQTEGVSEQDAEENIWTEQGRIDGKEKKPA
jgi:hypothetical protein